jgi:branched-subunit amino acid aminotransferase/4-amino-4-deoxychorismate lyase
VTTVRVLAADDADLALARALHLGDGLFESVLVAEGTACFLAEHLARLAASGAALGVQMPHRFAATISDHLPGLWAEEGSPPRAALRITLSRGLWTGLDPDAVRADPLAVLALRTLGPAPAALTAWTVDAPRIDPSSPIAGHKVISWMDKVEARRRARAAGADVALLRTTAGDVAEADAANLFAVVGGTLVTPPLDRGVLPGITRARVLRALRGPGGSARRVEERALTPGDLRSASEAFVTASLAGVVPLHAVDGRRLETGPWTSALARHVRPEGSDETPVSLPSV